MYRMFGNTRVQVLALVQVLLLSLSSYVAAAAPQSAAPASVGFWYAPHPPTPELAQYDWVVLEPANTSQTDIKFLRAQGSQPFAYLSVGEIDQGDVSASAVDGSARAGLRNQAWQSELTDLSSSAWQDYLLRRAGEYQTAGYAGLFLDTLDSFTMLEGERHTEQQAALVAVIQRIHRDYPGLKLFFNRGFEVLPELYALVDAVAVESFYAGWDQARETYRQVPSEDRLWLEQQVTPLRERGIPIVAVEYVEPTQRETMRQVARKASAQGYIPFISTPGLDSIGIGSIEVQPRRIAVVYDPREGELASNPGHVYLGGLLEYLGYRVDYLPADDTLPLSRFDELYAGVVVWMTSGAPAATNRFSRFLSARLDESVPLVFLGGIPIEDQLLSRLRLRNGQQQIESVQISSHDAAFFGSFEGKLTARTRGLQAIQRLDDSGTALLTLTDNLQRELTPSAIMPWGGYALSPYLLEEGASHRRWVVDPLAFLQRALRLPPMPRLDATTENGRRIATVHIDGDGFASRAEISGTPLSPKVVLEAFIQPNDYLTSVSVIEGEVGAKGMYPWLTDTLEPLARRIFADPKVEPATHTFSHPFYWEPEKAQLREGFKADYGLNLKLPNYPKMDLRREILGSRDYIEDRLLAPGKKVRLIFWSGAALPGAEAIAMAYAGGMANVNGAETFLTKADPSLTGLYPLLRPTAGGLQIYAPIINENLYTNLWNGPYYGFARVIDTFELTDSPRRLRALNLYYHFYSGTKLASIGAMNDIYHYMDEQQPISLWMSDYLRRVRGLYEGSSARTLDGRWQLRALQGMRTVRLDPALGWPDLQRSQGVAGVRDLPQGRYVHLSSDSVLLATRTSRDPAPALEQANLPLTAWRYLSATRVEFSFSGEFPLQLAIRYAGDCHINYKGAEFKPQRRGDLHEFRLAQHEVSDAVLACN
ncbi:MAG: bifunctional glycoside hydrolase 114/ polysaccharide deacetylase family protein [Halopseudomonas sp.]|uniref:bifunctional glycoside hydrolase 114/ polysaccharide deacetylase family protein n=1 Tax=Halopseudomonas sp. TaxID=2901191 RepID=UPI003002C264